MSTPSSSLAGTGWLKLLDPVANESKSYVSQRAWIAKVVKFVVF